MNQKKDSLISVTRLSIPISLLTTIIGGSTWLTTTRNDLNHLTNRVDKHIVDFKRHKSRIYDRIENMKIENNKQLDRLSRMEAKQDLILKQLGLIERRLNAKKNND